MTGHLPIAKFLSLSKRQRSEILALYDPAKQQRLKAASRLLTERIGAKNLRSLPSLLTEKDLGVDSPFEIASEKEKAARSNSVASEFDLARLDDYWRKKLIASLDKKEIKVLKASLLTDEYSLVGSCGLPPSLKASLIRLCRAQ